MEEKIKEALRYLGYGSNAAEEPITQLITDVFVELEQNTKIRGIYQYCGCHVEGESCVRIGNMTVKSRNLAKNLKGCSEVAIMGATLGPEMDMLLRKNMIVDMTRAVIMQACGAVLLEEGCDQIQEKIAREKAKERLWIRPRFSPGYGDFDIHHQGDILNILDAHKRIGLSMTESYMLTPTKSVTAVIGICEEKMECHKTGCESCEKKDCQYRRN